MLQVLRFAAFACVASAFATAGEAGSPSAPQALVQAVKERRVVTFVYQGQPRTVEPHACGVATRSGEAVLHGYQTDGGSASGTPPGWRTFSLSKIEALAVSATTFAAPRADYSSGRPQLEPLWAEVDTAEVAPKTAP